LRQRIWPESTKAESRLAFRDGELRGMLLTAAARLGHGFLDLYTLIISRIGSLAGGAQQESDDDASAERSIIGEYLDVLERQMQTPLTEREWAAFDELSELAENFDLVLDVNDPGIRNAPLTDAARAFGNLLREQQPVGGMFGQINRTLVQQFRLPGYPFVLISTDLLQEGEDLHTFCSSIQHYGISWTPSSMEQRIGRIDRVRSQTDRRLSRLTHPPSGVEKMQVYYPYLGDTVEILQVQRVLDRMNLFLRLMHEGLQAGGSEDRRIHIDREIRNGCRVAPAIEGKLRTAFAIPTAALRGDIREPDVGPELAEGLHERFRLLRATPYSGLVVDWEGDDVPGALIGTARLGARQQPFRLILGLVDRRPCVRCASLVGTVNLEECGEDISESVARLRVRLSATPTPDEESWVISVDDLVLLADPAHDATRVEALIHRVVRAADALEHQHMGGRDQLLSELRESYEGEPDAE
jgi:hypothetical protein